QRRHLRLTAEMLCKQLIDRDIGENLDFVLAAARRARKERSRSPGMDIVPTCVQAGEHEHVIAEWRQGLENGRKLEICSFPFGRPVLHGHTVWRVERQEAMRGLRSSSGASHKWREHRFQKGQSQ